MKIIKIDGIKYKFNWEASKEYVCYFRKNILEQKKSTGNQVEKYKSWYFNEKKIPYTGEILKYNKDFKNYNHQSILM